ncbi:hypothetical protein REPUB_Repub14bG0006600 [Reevesia pubescens]
MAGCEDWWRGITQAACDGKMASLWGLHAAGNGSERWREEVESSAFAGQKGGAMSRKAGAEAMRIGRAASWGVGAWQLGAAACMMVGGLRCKEGGGGGKKRAEEGDQTEREEEGGGWLVG